jgi:transcriptional regulator of acetoin/glycerol metabolism
VVAKGTNISVDDLPIPDVSETRPQDQSLESMEMVHIKNVLEENEWNITRSAEILGIDRATLYHKIKKYELRNQR